MRSKFRALKMRWRGFSRKKKIGIGFAAFLVLVLVAGALGYTYWFHGLRQVVSIDPNTGELIVKEEQAVQLNGRINILLIAADQRDNSQSYNTDSLILASIDPKTEQISMLSLPRDTRVEIPKRGLNKINSAASFGGLNMTVAVVQQLTGVNIDGYVKTNFQGFKSIIDTLGGITVNVEKNMYYETGDKVDGVINLKKGEQVLDGSKALQYARFRHDTYGDITRTTRQQVVLKAVAKKMMEPGSFFKIPGLIPQFYKAVETNLPLADLIKIAQALSKYDSTKVISQTLPGYFLDIDGISYWGVNKDEVKTVVAQLFSGLVTENTPDKLIKGSETVTTTKPEENKPPEDPKPQVRIGVVGIDSGKTTETSLTVMVTASTGIGRAEVWRTSDLGSFLVYPKDGRVWNGSAVTFTDTGLKPDTEYAYWLKAYDSKDSFLQATNPVMGVTKIKEEEEPSPPPPTPPTVPDTVYQ